ncbi:MAG: DJ-1/PfpI family protein [Deltaproteobacteria bacterium]|nr:DJ-1/PfpI family protein [Deltaproteobacteria bacterium]MBW2446255.1 DJ-1/PfpI family protein [Deltaproteobacteria bacterium]
MAQSVLIPLPDQDFDVTEVAVPWKLLREAGFDVVFATEEGATAAADPTLLAGVVFGQLGAEPEPKRFYRELEQAAEFRAPLRWRDLEVGRFDGFFLAGGHGPGMRQYLGSEPLQRQLAGFFALGKPVGAVCHGVLPLARAQDPATGRSVLHGRRTTCLPKYMERLGYYLTAWKLGRHYRTYDAYVEDEVVSALASAADFERGPLNLGTRGTRDNHAPTFGVEDGHYVSARWPGDSYWVAERFAERLRGLPA